MDYIIRFYKLKSFQNEVLNYEPSVLKNNSSVQSAMTGSNHPF